MRSSAIFLNLFILLIAGNALFAQQNDWENPEVFGINKRDAFATSFPFRSETLALNDEVKLSPFYMSLNGNWQFKWSINPQTRPLDFFEMDFIADSWAKIPVPSDWQMQGYGTAIYSNVNYPFNQYCFPIYQELAIFNFYSPETDH